jgi:thiamine-phosphate pyrophosphorylase
MRVSAHTATGRLARLRGLYVVVGTAAPGDPVDQARAALEGGAEVVQVRLKDAPAGEVLEVARRVVDLARGRALVLVNDRADLAVLAGADGVHVGDDDLPPADARRVVGPDLLVGRTCRTLGDARAAIAAGADHVGYGPVFVARAKVVDAAPRGLDGLAEVARGLGAPVVAIGGIDEARVGAVAAAGAACAAVVSAVFQDPHPRDAAARLARAFRAGAAPAAPEEPA